MSCWSNFFKKSSLNDAEELLLLNEQLVLGRRTMLLGLSSGTKYETTFLCIPSMVVLVSEIDKPEVDGASFSSFRVGTHFFKGVISSNSSVSVFVSTFDPSIISVLQIFV